MVWPINLRCPASGSLHITDAASASQRRADRAKNIADGDSTAWAPNPSLLQGQLKLCLRFQCGNSRFSCNLNQPGCAPVIKIVAWHVSSTQGNFEPLRNANMPQHQINTALTGARNNRRMGSISNIDRLFQAQLNDRLSRWVHICIKQNV